MRKLLPPCSLLVAPLIAIPAMVHADAIVEEIIARVNNQIVTRTEYQRSKEELKQEAPAAGPRQCGEVCRRTR